jgi:hypothetical protein
MKKGAMSKDLSNLSVAELCRILQALQEPEEVRKRRLWWSHFRRPHQASAKRCHRERRARQTPLVRSPVPESMRLLGLPALTDEHWEQLCPLLPPQKAWTGRPAVDHRTVVEGILFVIRTGCAWKNLPARFGPWQTVADRYRRWRLEGRWEPILQCLLQEIPIPSSA